jgi:hypothetical protein
MKPGTIAHGPSSLRVTFSLMVPVNIRGHVREITSVNTPHSERRKGHASALMRKVCGQADSERMTLVLQVNPYDECPMTKRDLMRWYGAFDFKPIQADPLVMARPPKTILNG